MNRIGLSGTDITVSRLAFGTATLHHLRRSCQRQKLLAAAVDLGFSHFDTSPYYGFGLAEYELGRFLRQHHTDITVASKVGLFPPGGRSSSTLAVWTRKAGGRFIPSLCKPVVNWSVSAAEKSLEQTLRTLGRDWLDFFFLHEVESALLDPDDFLAWLTRQKQAGKIRYWGFAGSLDRFADWLSHPLGEVLQVRDGSEVLSLTQTGREPQFTYGVLSGANPNCLANDAIRRALGRNPRGSVLVSTRKMVHLQELVEVVGSR